MVERVDKEIVFNKIESLRRCLARIKEKTPESCDALLHDMDMQDIISVNLERAVQQTVDIACHIVSSINTVTPDTMADSFIALFTAGIISEETSKRMVSAVGFRNIAVHNYGNIDYEIVYSISQKHLSDFNNFIKDIIKYIDSKEA